MIVNYSSSSGQVVEYGYTGAYTAGPTLTADDITSEGQVVSLTLTGTITGTPTADLNGAALTLTDTGGGVFTYPAPLIADGAGGISATLTVLIDGFTKTVDVTYTNTFPYNPAHGTPDNLSVMFGNTLGTTAPYELKVTSDTDPAIMTVDWDQIEADGAWLDDVTPYITMASGLETGTSSASFELFVTEDGTTETFTRSIENEGPQGIITIDSINVTRNTSTVNFSYNRADLTGYEYTIDEGVTLVATSEPAELTGLVSATPYPFWIRAINADGIGTWAKTTFTTNASVDTTPTAFSFTPQTNAARGITVTSNAITVAGVDAGVDVPVTVAGDTGSEYSVSTDGGSTYGGWTTAPTNVRLNYRIRVRHTTSSQYSSGGYDGVRETTLTVGGVAATFTSTTLADLIAPTISLEGGNISIVKGNAFVEPGYTATDNGDGDITVSGVVVTGSVDTNTVGTYTLTYTATDASGNEASTTRTVTVTEFVPEDTEGPVITLNGGNVILKAGDPWVDPGFSASDNVDGNLTSQVQVTPATVDTSAPTTITLTYSVADSTGNVGVATRSVVIESVIDYPFDVEAPANRTIKADRFTAFQSSENVFVMQSGEILDFDYDLTAWLALEDDTIAIGDHETAELSKNLDVLASGVVTGANRVKVWLEAGQVTNSESSLVQLKIVTTNYRTAVFQFRVVLINRMQ